MAYLSLRNWALEGEYFVKTINRGPVMKDNPLVDRHKQQVYSAWVVFRRTPEEWAYMDTFYYVKLNEKEDGGVLFTNPDRYEGVLSKAKTTYGGASLPI